MSKLLVAGSRTLEKDRFKIERFIFREICSIQKSSDVEIVSGMARGPDLIAYHVGKAYNLSVIEFPANWDLGKSAGMQRNVKMAKVADKALIFWDGTSKGTSHMISECKKRGIPTKVVYPWQLDQVTVTLSFLQVQTAQEVAKQMWGTNKSGTYGKGVLGGGKEPWKPFETGLVAEMAVAHIFGWEINLEYSENGEPWDFLYQGSTIDVKCLNKGKWKSKRPAHIKSGTLNSDLYLLCNRFKPDVIQINGWVDKSTILTKGVYSSPHGNWNNYNLGWDDIIRLETFVAKRLR